MSIACETCRTQARTVLRAAMRAGASRAAASNTRNFLPPVAVAASPRRHFSSTGQRSLLKGIGKSMAEPYRVLGATEQLFKASSKAADYHITEEARKNDHVELAKDGEEVGESLYPDSVWHHTFKLPPTFSTWSHVTMLHLYLINTRIRCFDREGFQNWQHQLTDHFFFECEKKMHIDHHITSSALRQRYLKDIFVQWRGLLLAYDEGLIKGDAMLASAIWRNLFKGSPDADPRALLAIVGWVRSTLQQFEAVSDNNLPAQLPAIMAKPVDVFWTRLEKQLGGQQEEDVPAVEPVKEAAAVPTGETPKVLTN
ncbi:Ff.00g125040.m01.CDS01 [Fusarium sp. VM40]|nr:Ff.00g125040.m01.CDS01 [Fusarium sp. VM40]